MLISGFSFARNAGKLDFPVVESIKSILPICDEFVIAVGAGDDDDTTRALVEAIGDPKIRIIDTRWENLATLRNRIYSQQTNLALNHCKGTWCFYIQADEVIHERYLPTIRSACSFYTAEPRIDGFLFRYKHFWGDYEHYLVNHRWYAREIRIIRNGAGIASVGDAQSFRYTNGKKVRVAELDAEVFHYGHARDPRTVGVRITVATDIFKGTAESSPIPENTAPQPHDYGSLEKLPAYTGSQPAVMRERFAAMSWKHLLQYSGPSIKFGHDRFKYRLLTFIEQKLLRGSGREFWGYKPYKVMRRFRKKFPEQPEASLIIAVYNHVDFLEKVFHSLKQQSFSNFEIIIADDGSGPEIADLVSRYRNTFAWPIKHVRHDDNGFRKTIIVNRAVVAADAAYCIFIDGDCLLHHRFIEYHMKRNCRGTVLSGRRVMLNEELSAAITPEDITTRRIEKPRFWAGKCNRAGFRHGFFLPGIFFFKNIVKRKVHDILGSNFSVFRNDFLKINGYDERIIGRGLEDDNLAVRFSMAGIPVKTVINEALQYHLHHSADPIPHDATVRQQFRDNPESAYTAWGIVRNSFPD